MCAVSERAGEEAFQNAGLKFERVWNQHSVGSNFGQDRRMACHLIHRDSGISRAFVATTV